MDPIPYVPGIETPLPDEAELIRNLNEMMVDLGKTVKEKHGRAFHGTHAKLVGLFVGKLRILADLTETLAQGMFAKPAELDTLVRFSPGPPEPLTDQASGQRGMSLKVMGVEGERIAASGEEATQDWVFGLDPVFTAPDAANFRKVFSATGAKSPYLPEKAILALSRAGRVVEGALEMVGGESGNIKFFARLPRHPMAETYYSQAPVRYGDYVAKLALVPTAATLDAIGDPAAIGSGEEAFSEAITRFSSQFAGVYELKVQLRTNPETMPVEDATAEWPEDESPYRTVAMLTLPPQNPLSPARRAFDDRIAFNPANALVSHRPLGSIMRARMAAYAATRRYRLETNGLSGIEPRSNGDIPD